MQVSVQQQSGFPEVETPTILVAEDHEDSRDALRALLEAFGFRVIVAANGREAIETALRHRPDLILMDIMMPELDGFEAIERIRAERQLGGTPIIAVTAMEGARPRALAAGANDCVHKPIEIRRLLERLREWLPGED